MAPAALRAPAPWVRASVPVTSNDVNSRSALTVFGVSLPRLVSRPRSLASRTSATAPLATAVAMLVPLSRE